MTPYYQDDYCTIYHGDCLEIAPQLVGIGAIISDPPYGMGWEGNQRFSGGNTRRGLGTKHEAIVGDNASFDPSPWLAYALPTVLWGANHFWNRLPPGASLIWQKRNENALGTFLSDGEIAFLSVGVGVYICRKVFAGSRKAIEAGRGPYAGSAHPNQKPIGLMRWCFERANLTLSATILDPYLGSGTTLQAAKEERRTAIGIEIEERYCEIAAKRLAQEVLAL